jgi:peptidyl-prolyl cis-trans isomerase D
MALIGTIRKNSWILVVMIALGLGGFLVMDMVSAGQGPGGGLSQAVMGKINGEKIQRTEFERMYGVLYSNSQAPVYQNRNNLWNWYIEEKLVNHEADALGLGLSPAEIRELEFGTNPSPIIRRNFPNPQQPGTINRQQLDYFKQIIEEDRVGEEIAAGRLAPSFMDFWRTQRREVIKDRMQSKLVSLVQKAMYTPNWMAEMGYEEQSLFIDFAYVKVPYDEIANQDVTISDSDLEAYLRENRNQYEREKELREMEYVVFNVLPTPEDSAAVSTSLAELMGEFSTAENDSNFVLRNEGIITPFYYTAEELSPMISDTVDSMNSGDIFGPYIETGQYKIVKVIDRALMADSADTRHILLSATSPDQFAEASERADSIMNVLRAGTTPFDSLVVAFSQDPGSNTNGGKYEGVTPNQFVPEFNRVLFITGEIGPLYKVRTSYGIHIVEVLSRYGDRQDRYNVAYIGKDIIPSQETMANRYEDAAAFIANNRDLASLRAAADEAGLQVVTAPPMDNNGYTLGALGYSNETRDIVCWAFSAYEGDVSPSVYTFTDQQRYYDNKYVIVGLSDIQYPGLPEVSEVRDELELAVVNEKKAEVILGRLANATDLSGAASTFNVPVDTASNVSFSQATVPGLGSEGKVIASAFQLEPGQTSAAIQGETGVFMVQTIRKPTLGQPTNLPVIRQTMNTTARNGAASLITFMREGAEVTDNRSTFECSN